MTNKRAPVIIVGMHRSGTSMLSRLMEREGLFWGKEKDKNNESTFFIALNEWILRELGARWDNPFGMLRMHEVSSYHLDMIVTYLQDQLKSPRSMKYWGVYKYYFCRETFESSSGVWGWKDPRTSLLLPIWLRLFPEAKVIHITRHGVDVANSLRHRSQRYLKNNSNLYLKRKHVYSLLGKRGVFVDSPSCLSLEGGFSLWENYLQCIEKDTQGLGDKFMQVRYEDILSSPRKHVEEILKFSGLPTAAIRDQDLVEYIRSDRAYGYKLNLELGKYAVEVEDRLQLLGY